MNLYRLFRLDKIEQNMKFALCNETFETESFETGCSLAALYGYTGLEIAPYTLTSDIATLSAPQRRQLRETAEQSGLKILGLHWLLAKTEGFYMTTPDQEVRKRTAEYFKELARLCAELGGSIMVCGSPKQRNLLPGVSNANAMDYAADLFQQAAPEFEKCGVTLAFEPLGKAETNFLNTGAQAIELCKKVGSESVKLHLDCKAICGGETISVPEAIRRYKDWTVHFHANDPNLRGPGFGDLDFTPIFQALKDTNYQGWVSVEMFEYSLGRENLAKESIRYMRECWDKVNDK